MNGFRCSTALLPITLSTSLTKCRSRSYRMLPFSIILQGRELHPTLPSSSLTSTVLSICSRGAICFEYSWTTLTTALWSPPTLSTSHVCRGVWKMPRKLRGLGLIVSNVLLLGCFIRVKLRMRTKRSVPSRRPGSSIPRLQLHHFSLQPFNAAGKRRGG